MKLKFSDRIGVTKPPETFQINEMNEVLRNSLWNIIIISIYDELSEADFKQAIKYLCWGFFKEPVDSLPNHGYENLDWLKERFYSTDFLWYDVYNFLEYLAGHIDSINSKITAIAFQELINGVLEKEISGYRFINGILAPIISEEEIQSITSIIQKFRNEQLFGTAKHISKAVELLSLKPSPDYRNSIKESISAVEAIVKKIAGEKSGGLDKALAILDSKVKFHGAFKSGLLSLYGYTSDEDGIRHPILEEKDIRFDEAKYMLVSCSALVNFLIAKAEKAGLLK